MTKLSITDIVAAFEYVNIDRYGDNSAVVNRETGEIFLLGDSADMDLPEDFDEDDEALVWIPDKMDLELDSRVALDFAREFCSDDFEEVRFIFSKRGAYAHFKRLLEKRNCLDKWYEYEEGKKRDALLEWCRENKIELEKEST